NLEELHTDAGVTLTPGPIFEIGGRTWHEPNFENRIFQGDIAEVIYFGAALTEVQQDQVESYLAVKYGITLGGATPTDYVDSVGTVFWAGTANATYHNDVAGIGRDDASALNQKQSRSVNDDTLVTMGLGTIVADNQ